MRIILGLLSAYANVVEVAYNLKRADRSLYISVCDFITSKYSQ